MIVRPAIDLLDGRVVRLRRGDPDEATVYDDDPRACLARFARAGARHLHLVDLSGAFAGAPVQRDALEGLLAAAHGCGTTVQLAGGLRTPEAAEAALAAGADRVVLGTLAVEAPDAAAALCRAHPGRIVVAVDARNGFVATRGWRTTTDLRAVDLARRAEAWGACAVLFTEIGRDGTGAGPAIEQTVAIQRAVAIPVIASGGVGTLEHLRALAAAGVREVVVGRALYEGTLAPEEAFAPC